MRATRAFIALDALVVSLWSAFPLALDPSLDLRQFAHAAWTFRNGFSNGAVFSIAQTADGYLWLGTQSGLFRFDGVRAIPLPLPLGERTEIGSVLGARDGTLWIGTQDGLLSWANDRVTEYPALAHYKVGALVHGRDRTEGRATGGPTGKLCTIGREGTTRSGDGGSLGGTVASLYEDLDGSLERQTVTT